MRVAIVTVASESYRDLGWDLLDSADRLIQGDFYPVMLEGQEGWPVGTECRHGVFADWLENSVLDVAFLLDADMLIEESFDITEIIPPAPGIVATLHPGYVGFPRHMLPYEDRPESRAFVPDELGEHYYAGGVIGGTRDEMLAFSRAVDRMIRDERDDGRAIRWHDESAANRLLAETPSVLTLDPAFCHPDRDDYYVANVWGGKQYARKVVALDKDAVLRGDR